MAGVEQWEQRLHDELRLADALTAGSRHREQVTNGLLRLVTVDEQGRPIRRRVVRDELPDPVVTELDAFVARRLLTTDNDSDTVVIGVVHEVFLSAWFPLARAITANVSALRARRAVEHATTEWHENGRPRERLWGGQSAGCWSPIASISARRLATSCTPASATTASAADRYSPPVDRPKPAPPGTRPDPTGGQAARTL